MELLKGTNNTHRMIFTILSEEKLLKDQPEEAAICNGYEKENLLGGLYNWERPCYNVMRNPARYDRFLSSFGCHQTNVGTHGSNGMAIWDG